MRARLEALAARLEAEAEARSNTADMQAVARAGVYSYCAAQIRALLSDCSRVRMEPQPQHWTGLFAPPVNVEGAEWVVVYRPESGGLQIEAYTAPSPSHRPVLIDGVWWWEVSDDAR